MVASFIVGLALAAEATASATSLVPVVVLLALLAGVSLAVGLLAAQPAGIGAAVVALAAAPFVGHTPPPPAGTLALYAGGLLLLAELAFWSLERRSAVAAERGVDARRWLVLAGVATASVAAALVILLAGAEPRVQGPLAEALGLAAAVAVAALALFLLRTRSARES